MPLRSNAPAKRGLAFAAVAAVSAISRARIEARAPRRGMAGTIPTWPAPPGPRSGDSGGERRFELRLEAALRQRADHALGLGAVAEQDQGRDREHVEPGRGLLVLIDVDGNDVEVVPLGRHLLEDRMNGS